MASFNRNTGDPVEFNSQLDWGNTFHRSNPAPLDRTELFTSYNDALAYAKGGADTRGLSGTSYPGQIVSVIDSDGSTNVYVIVSGPITNGHDDKTQRTLARLATGSGFNSIDEVDIENGFDIDELGQKFNTLLRALKGGN